MNEVKRFIKDLEQVAEDVDFLEDQIISLDIDLCKRLYSPPKPISSVQIKDMDFFNSIAFEIGEEPKREEFTELLDKIYVRKTDKHLNTTEYFILVEPEEYEVQEEDEEEEEDEREYEGSLYPSERFERSDNDR